MDPAPPPPDATVDEERFRWRGGAVSRIEGLSDGVFALALTFLIVSLQVPRNIRELLEDFRQVPVFALTFATFGWIWYLHHKFHRRYGLEDLATVTWNLVLLFLVLVYVYPLRFLATVLCKQFGIVASVAPDELDGLDYQGTRSLMLLYDSGFVALFSVMAMLYRHAWSRRDSLGLDARERVLTQVVVFEMWMTAGVGILSILLALLDEHLVFYSGMVYCLIGPLHGITGRWTGKRLREFEAGGAAPVPATPGGKETGHGPA